MPEKKAPDHLKSVYTASKPQEIAELYDAWAATYEDDMARAGYRHPSVCLALLCRHLPRGAAPLLDAGSGTGLIGEWLQILGFPHVEALDISEGMLEVAARKRVYSAFHRAALGGPLPFNDHAFAGIVSAGVFTSGHVGAEGLDELIRATRPDGVIVLTIKNTVWDDGFGGRIDALCAEGTISMVEQTEPYVSMPGETGTIPSRAIVLRVL